MIFAAKYCNNSVEIYDILCLVLLNMTFLLENHDLYIIWAKYNI